MGDLEPKIEGNGGTSWRIFASTCTIRLSSYFIIRFPIPSNPSPVYLLAPATPFPQSLYKGDSHCSRNGGSSVLLLACAVYASFDCDGGRKLRLQTTLTNHTRRARSLSHATTPPPHVPPPHLRRPHRLPKSALLSSSPTPVCSSSAILERDIEHILLPYSPPHSANRPLDPHCFPRASAREP
ncbi:hypothetical protein DFP72DRAFT_59155 [Ephemerocybe angulata]|uniref:Uncharacterized protein n=1 Tax=Ephemerocybe angulata TaxID=980116 RepID=A0A8H6LYD6_9AGAR|nr:hypothetical protein DFP72DRAFT_59155 [Tulosesus angulatus]